MNLSADTLDNFLYKMPMGVAVFNCDYCLRQCNEIWASYIESVTGVPADHVKPGLFVTELLPVEVVDLRPFLNDVIAGKTVSEEFLHLVTPKTTHYWNVFFSPVSENDKLTGALMITTDVTKGQRAEKAAQTARQALLTLMNSLPGMAYRAPLDPERKMELVNNGALELTGYTPDQFVSPTNIPFGMLIHEDDKETVWADLKTAVQKKQPYELLYRIRTADQQIKWVLEQGSSLFSPEGEFLAIEGFISDITERMLAQQILEQRIIDRTQKLSALYKMMTVTAEQSDLKTSLQRALSWVITAVHGQAGLVQLLDHTQLWLYIAVQVGLREETSKSLERVSLEDGPWGKVITTKKPNILANGNLVDNSSLILLSDLNAYAGLPIVARGNLLGVLNIWRSVPRAFSESDVALMVAAAEQMGTTIENARLRRDNERLLLLDERNRLARELHDAVTQSLYSLTLFAEANLRFAKANDFENVQLYSGRITETAERSLKEMRLLLHNLRPSILQNAGLVGALQQRLDSVEKRADIRAQLYCENDIVLPPLVEETLFYIAEEALNNSLKHAQASAVTVAISQVGTQVTLSIEDNGCGFDETNLPDAGGIGLDSMKERATMFGGQLTISSQPGKTCILLNFDLDNIKETTASQNLLDLLQD